MRPALALALVLLALTLALEFTPRARATGEARALELLIGAKGPLLPAGLVGGGPERIGEAMRVGDRTLVGDGGAGLRACFVELSGALRDVRRHDLGLASGLDTLCDDVARAHEGDVLLLASSGSLEPREDAARLHERRDELLTTLGAQARPGRRTPESWALIALRGARGWIPLAEGTSADSGVVLAFTLTPERTLARGFRADFVELHAQGGVLVELQPELARAQIQARAEAVLEGRVGGRVFPGILQQATGGEDARIVWEDVALGSGSGLLAWIGLADGASEVATGAELEVRVDGELAGRAPLVPGAPWKPFQVDLRSHAGRTVTLELVLKTDAAPGATALWGRPMLVHGYERSPLEVWAEAQR